MSAIGALKARLKRHPGLVRLKIALQNIFQLRGLRFLYVQRVKGFSIPERPYFDTDASTECFVEKLSRCNMYVEFGSGGSTYTAATLKVPFITVDSDRYFLNQVKKKIIADGLYDEARQVYRHADIGLTLSWGDPVILFKPTRHRLRQFAQYSDFPPLLNGRMTMPDLVLIDGRFRVACALKAIRSLDSYEGWTLLVDDYSDRAYYSTIARFAKLERLAGRMAVFVRQSHIDKDDMNETIKRFEFDTR